MSAPRRPECRLLDGGQRAQVVDTLITVLGQVYAHLPAKRAAYAHDPVQALTLLRTRSDALSDSDFHLAVTGIVTGLRDAHTRYVGPAAVRGHVAALPFLVEQYGPYDAPSFLVTKVAAELTEHDPDFQPGVRLEWWNAVPFARAVDLYADRETGGRPDSRRARALESMTFRALDYGPPPDEQWVDVGYRTAKGQAGDGRAAVDPARSPAGPRPPRRPGSHAGLRQATDLAAEAVRRAKKQLFAAELWAAESRRAAGHPADVAGRPGQPTGRARRGSPTTFQDTLAARPINSTDRLPADLVVRRRGRPGVPGRGARLLGLLPQGGLIVDLRGNPGGLIWAAERMLQLFTGVADLAHPVLPRRDAGDPADGGQPVQPARPGAVGRLARPGHLDRGPVRAAAAADRPGLVQRHAPGLPRPGGGRRRRQHLLLRRPVHGRLGRPRRSARS